MLKETENEIGEMDYLLLDVSEFIILDRMMFILYRLA